MDISSVVPFLSNCVYYGGILYSGTITVYASIALGKMAYDLSLPTLENIKYCLNMKKYTPFFTENFTTRYSEQHKNKILHRFAFNREREILQLESKLSIPSNSVVFLHGPAGAGKTAIFHELVYRQVTGKSKIFQDYIFVKLAQNQMFSLQKGVIKQLNDTLWGGGAISILDKLFESIRGKKIILFIDEAHEILKQGLLQKKLEELAQGEVKIILATTTDQMDFITHGWNEAMERRIPKIEIREFSLAATIKALKDGREDYESIQNISLDIDAIRTIVVLSSIPISESKSQKLHFPHKAVHMLGEICSAIKQGRDEVVKITSKNAIKHYAYLHDLDDQVIEDRVKEIILENNLDGKYLFFKKYISTHISQNISNNFTFLRELVDKLKKNFSSNSTYGVFLGGHSFLVQQAVIKELATDFEIIRINLKEMRASYNKMNWTKQILFLDGFKHLLKKCSYQKGKFCIIHIEDAESILPLLIDNLSYIKNSEVKSTRSTLFEIIDESEILNRGINGLHEVVDQFAPSLNIQQLFQNGKKENNLPQLSSSKKNSKTETNQSSLRSPFLKQDEEVKKESLEPFLWSQNPVGFC